MQWPRVECKFGSSISHPESISMVTARCKNQQYLNIILKISTEGKGNEKDGGKIAWQQHELDQIHIEEDGQVLSFEVSLWLLPVTFHPFVPRLHEFKWMCRLTAMSHYFVCDITKCNCKLYYNSFLCHASQLWNSLPVSWSPVK